MPRPPLAARFRLKGSRRHQETDVGGYPAHVVLFGHGEAHSPCGISLFLLESLVDGRAQRLGMARTAPALRICGAWAQCRRMIRPALRSVGALQVKQLINQRHILSRNVSDLLRTAPLWLWSECLDHPSQLDFGWRALGDIRKRMSEDIQHIWCCLDMAQHIRLARSRFFSLSRVPMGVPSALAWHALRRPLVREPSWRAAPQDRGGRLR